jgi:hypothetical protein
MRSFLFEIAEWHPEYAFSVGHDRFDEGPYSEHVDIEIKAICIAPKRWAGRSATFDLIGQRELMNRERYRHDPDWRPSGIAILDLRPRSGSFYVFIPYEALTFLLTGFAAGLFRYIDLWGPELKRSRSHCRSMRLLRAIDPEEYPD